MSSPARLLQPPPAGTADRPDRAYPISVDLEYRLFANGRVLITGTGRTVCLSRRCVWFESEKTLPVGVLVDLAVTWPALLENKIGLKLRIYGRTVSSPDQCTVVQILRHQFRTRAKSRP